VWEKEVLGESEAFESAVAMSFAAASRDARFAKPLLRRSSGEEY
jgi:hypothetical protein